MSAREKAGAWVQPMLNLFPQPNGAELGRGLAEWTGRFSRPAKLDIGGARLDHAVTPRLTLFGRYNESPSYTEFGSGPVNLLDLGSRTATPRPNFGRRTAPVSVRPSKRAMAAARQRGRAT